MNSNFISNDRLENIDFKELDNKSKNYMYYMQAKKELKEQFNLDDVLTITGDLDLTDDYNRLMNEFDTSILYKSDIHGVNHNIRVSYFGYVISSNEGISNRDFEIIVDACKYHDIGRENDFEDKFHGGRGANMLTFLDDKYSSEELNYLKTIVTCHSMNDDMFDEVATLNGIQDIERCRKMYNILKDADGLDRVRLEYPYINVNYLRTETARRMVLFSYKLFNNYDKLFR